MARRGEAAPTGAPYVAPGVDPSRNPGVEAYRLGIEARRGLRKQEMPLNPNRPPIPNLAGGPSDGGRVGGTMADYGRAERAAIPPPAPVSGSIIAESAPVAAPPQRQPTVASLGLAPADMLPPEARSDPSFIPGPGSEFAASQPALAARYGIIRNGQRIAPQGLGGGQRTSLSPKTLEDLKTLQQFSEGKGAPGADQSDAEARRAAEAEMGAAARVGNEPGDRSADPGSAKDRENALKNAIDRMDAFEFNQWRQLTMREILHSEDERKIVEDRLQPMDIGDMIRNGVIRQRIPIVPGKYEITLQNYDGETDIALKRIVMQDSKSLDVGDQYHLDKYGFMQVAVALHKINDKAYPEIMDAEGNFSDDLFLKKFNQVMKLPLDMLASIGIHSFWFSIRVRKLFSARAVGNG